jgi:hypothetical protein
MILKIGWSHQGENWQASHRSRKLLNRNEWFLPELANKLDIPTVTLYNWLRRGWVGGRQLLEQPRKPWVIRADTRELMRLRALRAAPKNGWRAISPVAQA